MKRETWEDNSFVIRILLPLNARIKGERTSKKRGISLAGYLYYILQTPCSVDPSWCSDPLVVSFGSGVLE